MNLWGITKEDLCIEVQEMGKNFALIIKSSLFEAIFIDAKGLNCASLETVHAKKMFLITISEVLLEHKHHPVSEFIGHHICKQNAICAINSFKYFIKVIRNCFCNYYVSYSKSHNYFSWLNFVKNSNTL